MSIMAGTQREMRAFKCEFADQDFKGRPKKSDRLITGSDSDLLGLGMQVVLEAGRARLLV